MSGWFPRSRRRVLDMRHGTCHCTHHCASPYTRLNPLRSLVVLSGAAGRSSVGSCSTTQIPAKPVVTAQHTA
jgi:hypothetical protein